MFNFFKAKPKEEKLDDEDISAAVHYIIKKGSNQAIIDVEMHDYDDESVQSLCSLLEILGNDLFYIDTINMIKGSLLEEKREDILIKIFTKINTNIRTKLLNAHADKTKDEPCIKPSDMLR